MVEVCGLLSLPVRRKGWAQGPVVRFARCALNGWMRVRKEERMGCCCSVRAPQGVLQRESSEALEDVINSVELR